MQLGVTLDPAATQEPGFFDQLPGWIVDIQTAINTQRLLDLNIERARQGLPPISASSVAPTVNVGVSPQMQQMLLYGGVALLAVMLIKRSRA